MILYFDTAIANARNILDAVVLQYLGDCSMNPDAVREDGDWVLFTDKGFARALHLDQMGAALRLVLVRLEHDGLIEIRHTQMDHVGFWVSLTERGRNMLGLERILWNAGIVRKGL